MAVAVTAAVATATVLGRADVACTAALMVAFRGLPTTRLADTRPLIDAVAVLLTRAGRER